MTAPAMLGTEFGLMEGPIEDVLSWANVLIQMGSSPHMIEPDAVRVIGYSLNNLAGTLSDHYQRAHENEGVAKEVAWSGRR